MNEREGAIAPRIAANAGNPRADSKRSDLTHSQRQIWIGQRLHPKVALYNMAFAFLMPVELRPDLFVRAWQRVADGSDALRTRVVESESGPQRLLSRDADATELLDFSTRDDPEAEFLRWSRDRCSRPLPLEGSLTDSVLVRLGSKRTGWYLNQHHLVTDAWSTRLLYREVGAEYERLLAVGRPPDRLRLSAYYPTAEAVRSANADRGNEARHLDHWKPRWERGGRPLPLYGRAAEPGGTESTRLTLELDQKRTRALAELAGREGFNSLSSELSGFALFATLLLSWLSRLGGDNGDRSVSELGFDTPVAGRPTPESKLALGLFIEMFPFAAKVEPTDTFRSLGARCLEEAKALLLQAVPGTSAPSGVSSGRLVLNYVPGSFGDFAGAPAAVEWLHPGHADGVHALRVQVHDFSGSGRTTLHFDFNDRALPDRLRRRSLRHFETLLDALLDDPDRRIAAIDLLTSAERGDLARLNDTAALPLPKRSAIEMFRARAETDSERVALRQGDVEVSFGELAERVDSLAARLLRRGVERGDPVAVTAERSIDTVIAILAIMRSGAAYVPIDPAHPVARRSAVLDDCGARLLLAGDGSNLLETEIETVSISEARAGAESADVLALDRRLPALDDLCYVLYTSGSTGRPKGVLIEHGGLADYLEWAVRRYVRGDRLRFALFTSLAFDLTVTSLFLPLITGGKLEIYSEPEGPIDSSLVEVVRANAVDFIKLTPSHLSLLLRLTPEDSAKKSNIRRMVVGGEDLKTALASEVAERLGDRVEIHNEYGPTEAVVGCVAHRFDRQLDTAASVPIGRPADHVEVDILNEALTRVPEGVPGELWISRYGLGRGYQGLEQLTAERFPHRPDGSGERRYRTGDRVRLVEPGKLEYLGRLDRQLKISGFRVEPAEIEAALLALPEVTECTVVARRRGGAAGGGSGPSRSLPSVIHCARCGLPSNHPQATFDREGVCGVCRSYDAIHEHAQDYFKTMDDLRSLFEESAAAKRSRYDCLMLYSGGKDSTYALCRLVDLGLSVFAFTLDNGFISEGAKTNIRRVTEELGVPVEFATTPAMNAIFRDSLQRFSNVCQGCFKTIYTLSVHKARELGIPIVVTGLSRGQMFETRLTEEMFRDGKRPVEEIDSAVLAARRVYHRIEDEVSRSLDVEVFRDDRLFEEIRFVDFYRYCDIGLGDLFAYLRRRVPWVRPEDTGRSTNCLINDVGIYVHQRQRGFHNYALPYSWDVRMGHKTRAEALAELDDEIDPEYVKRTLVEIGSNPDDLLARDERPLLAAYYVSRENVGADRIRNHLAERLPPQLIPSAFQRLEAIPLTVQGKADTSALPPIEAERLEQTRYRSPEGPVEEYLAEVWRRQFGVDRVGADDDFFELGGTSLGAMEVMIQLCQEFDIELPLETLFAEPRLSGLARAAEDRILADVAEISDPGDISNSSMQPDASVRPDDASRTD